MTPDGGGGSIVIAGGGPAAYRCAFSLRERGFGGRVLILSAESDPPYDRTKVSKSMLTNNARPMEVALASRAAYSEQELDLRLGCRVVGLDHDARTVALGDGSECPYDRLLIATGGRPRLPNALMADGVIVLRTAQDARRLSETLGSVDRIAIVGAGFIGSEVATAAVARGVQAVLIEATPAPLSSLLGTEVGRRIEALHTAAGVEVYCDASVTSVTGGYGDYRVVLGDGRTITAGAVVVGVGMEPEVDWLAGSPIELADGILIDDACRTSLPHVLAAGDCARWRSPGYGATLRLEHWDVAMRQGEVAAATMLGETASCDHVPFFWSDLHSVTHRWVGYAPSWDRVDIVDHDSPRRYVAHYFRAGRLVAAFAAADPRAISAARRELQASLPLQRSEAG